MATCRSWFCCSATQGAENSNKNSRKSSFELQKDLAYFGAHVSSATVRHRLIEAGQKAKNPTKKELLTQKMMKKRLA